MEYSFKLDNGVLYVFFDGRLDTENSLKFEQEITGICKENQHNSIVLDASGMEYIASSGLRTILKLAKTEKNFKIENMQSSVYNTLISANPEIFEAALDRIDSEYGSFRNYLTECIGVTPAMMQVLRNRYLE